MICDSIDVRLFRIFISALNCIIIHINTAVITYDRFINVWRNTQFLSTSTPAALFKSNYSKMYFVTRGT